MKTTHITLVLLLLFPVLILAQDLQTSATEPSAFLIGTWKIDLRPTPDSEGYYQTFEVKIIEDNSFTGTFYGSDVKNGLINKNWDKVHFAFSTADQNNDYYHSGYLENDVLFGMTYCPTRNFAAPWVGNKNDIDEK